VNITDQFFEICIFLANNGFVPILKKLAVSSMSAIETHCITGKQTPHEGGNGSIPGPEQEMSMIGQKGPRIAGYIRFRQQRL
jgi:hypothetical protein